MREKLEKFGKVEQCEELNDMFYIKITDGFYINAMNTFELIKIINNEIGHTYKHIDKLVTENNLFYYILKK